MRDANAFYGSEMDFTFRQRQENALHRRRPRRPPLPPRRSPVKTIFALAAPATGTITATGTQAARHRQKPMT
jgi:hypothetical protein